MKRLSMIFSMLLIVCTMFLFSPLMLLTASAESTISADNTIFNYTDDAEDNPSNIWHNDISVAMNLTTGDSLSNITEDGNALIQDTDYSVSGNTVIIKKEYLSSLPNVGPHTLAFHFLSGSIQPLVITVIYAQGFYLETYNGHIYAVDDYDSGTWSNAEDLCESYYGGHLATITSQGEQDIIADMAYNDSLPYINNTYYGHCDHWLGASDAAQEGSWVWMTGEPVSYTNWEPGKPTSASGSNYMTIWGPDKEWVNHPETNHYCPLVEWEPLAAHYTLTYDKHGGSYGTQPGIGPYTFAQSTTLIDPSSYGLKLNGCSFIGWNTKADGSGTNYAAGDPFTVTGEMTLYAQWIAFNSQTGEVTGCNGNPAKIVIPSSIDGVPVTSIGDNAFRNCSGLTSISIPNSITSIGDGAFYDCSSLTGISIPNSVTSIGKAAFAQCTNLTGTITLPAGLKVINDNLFVGCLGLTGISIPDSVTSIGDDAFYYCTNLTSAYFYGNAPNLGTSVFDDVNGSFKVYYPNGNATYDDWTYPKQSFSLFGLVNKGVQKKIDESAYDIRFLATIDTLEPDSVGFVYSRTNTTPTIGGNDTQKLETTTVYTSIIANGLTKIAADLSGTYIIACKITGVSNSDIFYVRAFATKGTATTYSDVKTVTVSGLN